MARLTVARTILLLAPLRFVLAQAPDQESQLAKDFERAGVCARCHVVSVMEWRMSGHLKSGTDCVACHGPSQGHVYNERNEVEPDRIPRGAEMAKLCSNCHTAGCTKTREVAACQKCHHFHGLMNPATASVPRDERLNQLVVRWESYRSKMEEGERLVQAKNWAAARQAFAAALELIPGNRNARSKLELCDRRLDPSLPGFEISGNEFDAQTALPKEVRVAGLGIPMVLVPPGQVDIGADYLVDSKPVHTVSVEAYYLGKFELTQSEWKLLMGTNPSLHQGQGFPEAARMPVEDVSWNDCQALIRKLNELVPGGGFRLPTEAEWEYAARAGSPGPFESKGLAGAAWFRENSRRQAGAEPPIPEMDQYAPRPVGTKEPNGWGLYDMMGNVWEWTSSVFAPYAMPTKSPESPTVASLRVLRGGGFVDSAEALDYALRHGERPDRRFRWNGLRLARTVPHRQMASR
jgi:formylglycine-generating enzyme required for sulfatase activity